MDWSKVDARLAELLADAAANPHTTTRQHAVFVHLLPDASAAAADDPVLQGTGAVRTGMLTPAEIDRLSDQAWVRELRWSATLRPGDRG